MSRISDYEAELPTLTDWEPYLLNHSGLPGPRGNLELAHAVARCGTAEQFLAWSSMRADVAPENTPEVFLAFCGALGLGALLGRANGAEENKGAILASLRRLALDPRWRVREAVATGLQLWGDADMPGLLAEMAAWTQGNYYEQRAAAAALCEPRLLKNRDSALAVLDILDQITHAVAAAPAADRKSDPFRTLRQALGYCWSVAVAAEPEVGVVLLRKWLADGDFDVRWIMRENLQKKRIAAIAASAGIHNRE